MRGVLEGAELNMCLVEHPPNHSTAACGWCASMCFTAPELIVLGDTTICKTYDDTGGAQYSFSKYNGPAV